MEVIQNDMKMQKTNDLFKIWFVLTVSLYLCGYGIQLRMLLPISMVHLLITVLLALVYTWLDMVLPQTYRRLLPLIFISISAISTIFFHVDGIDSVRLFINQVLHAYNVHHQSGIRYIGSLNGDVHSLIWCFYCVMALSFFLVRYAYRKKWVVFITFGPCVMALIAIWLGIFSIPGFIFMMIGIVGFRMRTIAPYIDARRIIWFGLVTVFLFAGMVVMNRSSAFVALTKAAIVEHYDHFAYGTDTLPKGDLTKADQIHEDSALTRLTITTQQQKNMYLKGFVGDVYEDNQWKSFPQNVYGYENSGMLKWLDQKSFQPVTQYAKFAHLTDYTLQENQVSITNHKAYRKYIYAPYSIDTFTAKRSHINEDQNIESVPFLTSGSYQYTEYSDSLPSELQGNNDLRKGSQTEDEQAYLETEKVYRDFVYQNYLTVDEALKPYLKELFLTGETVPDTVYAATLTIRSVLETDFVYREQSQHESTNVMYDFLRNDRSGNDVLFASASVLAYRLYGIPARYVEGYYAPSSQNQTNALTSTNAHAWVEVYLDGVGWMPVDTTPGYYYDTFTMIQMVNGSHAILSTTAEESSDDLASELKDNEPSNDKGVVEKTVKATGHILFGLIVVTVLIVMLLGIVILLIRLVQLYVIRYRIQHTTGRKRAQLLYRRIRQILAAFQVETSVGWNVQETEMKIQSRFPDILSGEYVNLNQIMEKMYYSNMALLPFEENRIEVFYGKLLKCIAGLSIKEVLEYHFHDGWNLIVKKVKE